MEFTYTTRLDIALYEKNNKEFHKYKFAEKLCCDNKTVYNIFQNRSIHTATLISISKILDFDFIEFLKEVYGEMILKNYEKICKLCKF